MTLCTRVYRWVYTFGGLKPDGRPFTWISQDTIKTQKAAWVFGCIACTILFLAIPMPHWFRYVMFLGIGFVLGHIFWHSTRQTTQAIKAVFRRDRSNISV